ncbi:hypothetical protein BGX38DRAFT_1073413, partial [Terfezia claveryi]
TLVPILFVSNVIHLTNLSSDSKVWPIYISISNIKSRFQKKPTSYALILVALLP